MANVQTVTNTFNGPEDDESQVVAVADYTRKYIGLYSQTGECEISVGEGTHSETYLTLAEGNLLEFAVNIIDKVTFSRTDSVLRVIQDINSKIVLHSDGLTLTYDGEILTYQRDTSMVGFLAPPVFS